MSHSSHSDPEKVTNEKHHIGGAIDVEHVSDINQVKGGLDFSCAIDLYSSYPQA
jgi:hypothetical protein